MAASLHQTSLVIDGLIISDFGRPVFEDMRKGGLTAANCHLQRLGRLYRDDAQCDALEGLV